VTGLSGGAGSLVQTIAKEGEMRNRSLWIIVALVVVGTLLCCCIAAGAAGLAAYLTAAPTVREGGIGRIDERTEQTFDVGRAPMLEVDTFAGSIRVLAGGGGEIRVKTTKQAGNSSQLDEISVDVVGTEDGVRVRASAPSYGTGRRAVDVELMVPPDARLRVDTGAGNVEVEGVVGEIEAHTGAGNIEVEGGAGPVNLDSGAGEVAYTGSPEGGCVFSTGAGNVTLRMPAALDAEVELHTGIGTIELDGFDVAGEVSDTEVDGVIGSGERATIEARTGAGDVDLVQQ